MLIKRGNAKKDFVFKVFLCFEARHTESNERALPFGYSESLRLPFLLTLAGTCVCISVSVCTAGVPLHRACGQMGTESWAG